MSEYSYWTTDALRGTAVMLVELLSGSLSETGRISYEKKLSFIQQELHDRDNGPGETEKALAFPSLKTIDSELK
jgi:hypothetical protein